MRLSKRQYECKGSLEFALNEKTFYVQDTGHLMTLKKDLSDKRYFEHSLRLHLSKHKVSLFDILGVDPKRCVFCNRINTSYFVQYSVDQNRNIKIIGVGYRKDISYCFDKGKCLGKELNPNSVEFVAKTNGISEGKALELIHRRNKSPFYKENHKTSKDYSAAQRKYFYGRPPEKVKESIQKILNSRLKSFEADPQRSKKTAFTFISKSERGDLLCSNGERYLYQCFEKENIVEFVKTNGFYEDSTYCYDFFIPNLNMYIEIAGMSGESYEHRLQEKITKFGAIVLKSKSRIFKRQCEELAKTIRRKLHGKL